jgi:hypothetical protein
MEMNIPVHRLNLKITKLNIILSFPEKSPGKVK